MRKITAIDVAIGMRIRERRRSLRMSQRELARRIGLSYQQVQKYEGAKTRVPPKSLARMAGVFEVNVDWFFGGLSGLLSRGVTMPVDGRTLAGFLGTAEGRELNLAFSRITDLRVRRHVIGLVRAIAGKQ
ncbi:helix-turn-helix transcriptional regulator [Rhizobium daejeonense]|uniref:Helix-turn-helix transcriptional regulator n=1 Tax=Rhizobium daejeonense TaxID=240521 RepID=A0A6M1S6U2_9HYPH|nr:helix-turn-helix transcriptional regulator [Rhizobium daejeonense]NGO66031.1 helix-turn-helix transcriptional regulator [Rhizobium daejeonense]